VVLIEENASSRPLISTVFIRGGRNRVGWRSPPCVCRAYLQSAFGLEQPNLGGHRTRFDLGWRSRGPFFWFLEFTLPGLPPVFNSDG